MEEQIKFKGDDKATECKRCGCDFPGLTIFSIGCENCETPNEMFKRSMNHLKGL